MLSIRYKFAPESLSGLRFDSGMGKFDHYSSIIRKTATFRDIVTGKDGKVALAIVNDQVIVGYVACGYPELADRWSKLGELMYEMGAIEVSRNFRQQGIARHMIDTVLCEDFFEDKIAYMRSFSWHWDLDGTGLSIARYRKMMLSLMQGHGFLEHYTNEPNVALKRENIFMARIGSRVPTKDKKRFDILRFGVTGNRDRFTAGCDMPRQSALGNVRRAQPHLRVVAETGAPTA